MVQKRRSSPKQTPPADKGGLHPTDDTRPQPAALRTESTRSLRFDAPECPVVHANMVVLTRGRQGSTRVIVF